ncbi:hypothetical protein HRM2_14620 [Desulforapulum autotrophicum HRM2]|uniref:Uncharacterized protein n=1 Tax=Desulforapulum autotrophicum (strain ATCC 43914 / DSM 3382 / VKM B-1955 / HRM2) TaxID=177437 RepID=C0Q9K7_DESAH|nr:hypothetical protein [Desulforapulum autotrophicum]ACN14571.1 hypothetical protein HRM2_14620 [Desulforapulum autotrophicum HRM2]
MMKYIANFSVNESGDNTFGSFSVILSAEDPGEAIENLKKKIIEESKTGQYGMFKGIDEIYFDSLIEMEKIPREPVIINFKSGSVDGMGWGEVRLDLADAPEDFNSYGWTDDENDEGPESGTVEPFIKFSEIKKNNK